MPMNLAARQGELEKFDKKIFFLLFLKKKFGKKI